MRRKTTTALLAALCLILLLRGCGLRAAKDRPAVTPLSCPALDAVQQCAGGRPLRGYIQLRGGHGGSRPHHGVLHDPR